MRQAINILFTLFLATGSLFGQSGDRFQQLENQLSLMISSSPGLEEPVDLSVSGVPLGEFIRALGNANQVNLSVDSRLEGSVVNNFSNVTVAEVLVFLAKEYALDMRFTGNIIHVFPYREPAPPPEIRIPRSVQIYYDPQSELLSLELKKDSLPKVARAITQSTGYNLVYAPGLENKRLSIYLEEVSMDEALDKIAFANDLQVSKTGDGFYLLEELPKATGNNQRPGEENLRFLDLNEDHRPQFSIDSNQISLHVENKPLAEVIRSLFQNLDLNYYLYAPLQGNVTLQAKAVGLEELLYRLFSGTPYTFRQQEGAILIGERDKENLREVRRITLFNRSVDNLIEYIPADLKNGVEIKEFDELNSLLLSGSYPQIQELEKFIKTIDQPVPVVIIEVMIVDYNRNNTISNGIEAGIGDQPVSSGGQIFPGIDYQLGAESINKLLASFDGFGALNLGAVTPNFYLNLKLLENNGILNVKSTPKLSTLNGHEANISIGNTEYYVVEQTNVTGVQNPLPITTRNYQSVQANFNLKIRPMVSADNQVTLEINVEQTDFTARISPEAPPGSVSRNFTSMIRVREDEMVLLGGLEEKGYEDTGSGFPFLSRIPIIKWFFSSRTRNERKSRLNVFIKPTVIY